MSPANGRRAIGCAMTAIESLLHPELGSLAPPARYAP